MQIWRVITNFFIMFLFVACSQSENQACCNEETIKNDENKKLNAWSVDKKTIQGNTQGTTFTIKTSDDSLRVKPIDISKLLTDFDLELSGYIPNSILSKINSSDSGLTVENDTYFTKCYLISQEIYKNTNGAFDPSVFPIVKAWGFFKNMEKVPSNEEIDSLLNFIGFENGLHHTFDDGIFYKNTPSFQLDFNAIAQGQSADVIGDFLEVKGHENYFIEVGGEIKVKGLNNDGQPWIIGIDEPTEINDGHNTRKLENYLSISNGGIATSGNYRKFHQKNGKKYSHTLNPKTGFPVEHNLLSTTVIAETAAMADGYATAFMTLGVEKTMQFLAENPSLQIEAYLLFENDAGRIERMYTNGMTNYFLEN